MQYLVCLVLAILASTAQAEELSAPAPAPAVEPASAPAVAPAVAPAAAAASGQPPSDYHYVLGLQYSLQPQYPGSAQEQGSFAPVWALRWGRLRLSNGGGSSLMGFGTMVYGPGASAELLHSKNWHLGISLRYDSGRDSDGADSTRGLPDVPRTVRGRVFASNSLTPDVLVSAYVSQDLLGRGGGLIGGTGVDWRLAHDRTSEWTIGTGVGAGNVAYMQSYFGVTEAGSAATGLRTYTPGGGLQNAYAGLAYTHALDRHWIVYASAGASRLLGPAAASPLDERALAFGASVRLAYRR